jgi:hypothetical protein
MRTASRGQRSRSAEAAKNFQRRFCVRQQRHKVGSPGRNATIGLSTTLQPGCPACEPAFQSEEQDDLSLCQCASRCSARADKNAEMHPSSTLPHWGVHVETSFETSFHKVECVIALIGLCGSYGGGARCEHSGASPGHQSCGRALDVTTSLQEPKRKGHAMETQGHLACGLSPLHRVLEQARAVLSQLAVSQGTMQSNSVRIKEIEALQAKGTPCQQSETGVACPELYNAAQRLNCLVSDHGQKQKL